MYYYYKTIIIFFYIILNVNCKNVSSDTIADWSPFTDIDALSLQESLSVINSIHLKNYWDVAKGEFRTGVIGSEIVDTLPDFVIRVDKKIGSGLHSKLVTNIPVVDTQALLSRSISVIQYLASERITILENDINKLILQRNSANTNLTRFSKTVKDTITNSKISILLKAERELLQYDIDIINSQIDKEMNRKLLVVNNEIYRNEHRKVIRINHHEKSFNISMNHQRNLNDIIAEKSKEKINLINELESNLIGIEDDFLTKKLDLQIELMKNEIKTSLDIIKFKYEEESRLERENEDNELKILITKDEFFRNSAEEIILFFATELSSQTKKIFDDPINVIYWCGNLILLLFSLVVIYEVLTLIPVLLVSLFSKSIGIHYSGENFFSRNKNKNNLDTLTLHPELRNSLQKYITTLKYAKDKKSNLPSLLLTGDNGTGKSISALKVSEVSGLPIITFCESDLETLGDKAGIYLRQELSSTKNDWFIGSNPAIIIIDSADALVGSRSDKSTNGDSRGSSISNCFYVLLEAIRESSPNISIIITTNKHASEIDSAILDRIDFMVNFPLPNSNLRLEFILVKLKSILFQFLQQDEKNLLNNILNINLESCPTNDILSIIHSKLSNNIQISSIQTSPETDRPSKCSSSATDINILSVNLKEFSSSEFDVKHCIICLICNTEMWSYRELEKFLLGIRSEVLGTVDCKLSTFVWMSELKFRLIERNRRSS